MHSGLQPHVLARGQELVQRRLLQRDADLVPDSGPLVDDVVAGHPRGSGRRREQGGEHVHGGRLAGPVGAEEAVDLTRRDREVDPVHRPRALLELPHEALDLDPVVARMHARSR